MSYIDSAAYRLINRDAPVLILAIHGLTGDSGQPLQLLSTVDDFRIGILAPDLRAHGGTAFDGETADFVPGNLAADLIDLIESLDLTPTVVRLIGISLGATVALEIARARALPVDRAVYVRPAHGIDEPRQLRPNRLIAELLTSPATALERLIDSPDYRRVSEISAYGGASLRAKVTASRSKERRMRLEAGSLWRAFDGSSRDDPSIQALVIGALRDPLHPISISEDWHRRLAGSSLEILPSIDQAPTEHRALSRGLVADFVSADLP